MFFLEKYPTHKKKFKECLKLNSWNGFFVSALLNLGFNWDISVWTTIQNFFSRWLVTRNPKATSIPLELWKYANFTKPGFFPFLNHWINFDEQCEFLHRMDVDAIFQQINLRYEWAIWVSANSTLNRMDVDMIFFSFSYSSSLSISESCADSAPRLLRVFFDPQRSFGNPLRTFRQYLASPVLEKSRFFLLRWNFPP